MSSDGGRKIVLRSSDGKTFEVEEVVALQMQPIKHMIEDKCADQEIPLPNVTSLVLSKVIEYGKKHAEACYREGEEDIEVSEGELYSPHLSFCELLALNEYSKSHCPKYDLKCKLKAWDTNFVKVDHNTLFDLILAANYLNIKSLLDLTCQAVADLIKGKTPEEIRGSFNLKTPITPEEEEEIRRENQWAFE